ncbi:M20/M25/M40 family metallo-hydrolase [Polynucleobacter necessarius]|uniref:M20/M25/M40 family metallo-hydrolase n=1 Tax=Polynucleobacter necessarius TaxID=576610 RepID=UPI0013B04F11|nr:M20/M25/M40 family metallo-hydrolase [Polynucleobacter necessarius]
MSYATIQPDCWSRRTLSASTWTLPQDAEALSRAYQEPPNTTNICFTGHVDVVPLGDRPWDHDPFSGVIQDGKLFGRGSSDMKSGIAAFIVAAMKTANLAQGKNGISMIITAGEETGCEGAFYIAQQKEVIDFIGKVGYFVVAEPTANEPITLVTKVLIDSALRLRVLLLMALCLNGVITLLQTCQRCPTA